MNIDHSGRTPEEPIKTIESQGSRASKRKHVTTACIRCKSAKAKCDGRYPCGRCLLRNKQCAYTGERDARSLRGQSRKDSELLHDLLTAVRNTSEDILPRIMSLMRSQSPIEHVKARLNDELNMMQAASAGLRILQDPVQEEWSRTHSYRQGGSRITRLVDTPPYQVTCQHWTSVTNDDRLVSHLVSLWLVWDKPFYNWMDQHLFLRDMRRGTVPSNHCSRLLVNAILASACAYSDYHEARTVDGAASTLMQAFISEAKRHLEMEMQKPPTVTTVQGLGILLLTLALTGQDRLGVSMLMQVMAMSDELERLPPTAQDSVQDAQDLARSVSLACWSIYNMSSAVFVSFMKPQFMRMPRCKPPLVPQHNYSWIPYPHHTDPLPSCNDELVSIFCDVQVIAHSLSQVLFDDTCTIPTAFQEEKVIDLHRQLLQILNAIPPHLLPREGATPTALLHHVWYQTLILRMYVAFQTPEHNSSMAEQVQSICIEAAIRVSEILDLHIRAFGCETIQNTVANGISLALFTLLKIPNNQIYNVHVTRLFVCLNSMSRRWPMLMGILRMVQHYAREMRFVLPQDTDILLVGFEDDWYRRRTRRFASVYPQPAVMIQSASEGRYIEDMGRFLERVETLTVNAK